MIPRPTLTKMPGGLQVTRPEKHTCELGKLNKAQLLELRDRQSKLLSNKQRISILADKGVRVQALYDRIVQELAQHDEIQKAADLFSELNIASTGQNKLNTLEWTGNLDADRGEAVLDSDDDEEVDPLRILAQRGTADKVVKFIKPEKTLITDQDLSEIKSFKQDQENDSVCSETPSTTSVELEPHATYLIDKAIEHPPATEKFMPYKTTRSNVHDPEKEKLRKRGKYWENTAATPPPIIHNGVKMLTLHESIEVQAEYEQRLKHVIEKQAQERLIARGNSKKDLNVLLPDEAVQKLSQFFGSYRSGPDVDSDSDEHGHIETDDEVHDDDDDRGGCVTFTSTTYS